jgi:UDP-N-acetylglucosamine acyltransferase
MTKIHPQAYVDPSAEIGEDVEIGPFCFVGAEVTIGRGTRLMNNVSVHGPTSIGCDNLFFPFCSVGSEPQDLSFQGERSRTEIGDRNTFRECVTIHRGTAKDECLTKVGSDNLLMACAHVAHDCVIEDHVIMANSVLLGGHVLVESHATFGGAAVVHHFTTVGRMAFVGGMTRITKDVPPFMTVEGNPPKVWMVNKIGCSRRGVAEESIEQLKEAHRLLFRSDSSWEEALELLGGRPDVSPELRYLLEFCRRCDAGIKGRSRELIRVRHEQQAGGAGGASSD